jgi:hypothetical protein
MYQVLKRSSSNGNEVAEYAHFYDFYIDKIENEFGDRGEGILSGTSWTNLSRTSAYQAKKMETAYGNNVNSQFYKIMKSFVEFKLEADGYFADLQVKVFILYISF